MPEFLFDGKATLAALLSLAGLLAARAVGHQTLIIVGGSYLALNDLRESTRDIDSVTRQHPPSGCSQSKRSPKSVNNTDTRTIGSTTRPPRSAQTVSGSKTAPSSSITRHLQFAGQQLTGSS